jgi:hypothetical protein
MRNWVDKYRRVARRGGLVTTASSHLVEDTGLISRERKL